jgi:dephospho-CoA kinase
MLKVGLTGSIAVGKSSVLAVFRCLGCATLDADKIAHSVMEPGREAYSDVVSEFGEEILAADQTIDRGKLGAVVFADEERRKRLNEIVHPRVIREQNRLLAEIEERTPDGIAIIDAALMIESGGYKRLDKLIVVYCDARSQLERLMRRNNLSREGAELRIRAQMSSDEKRKYADYEIDTSGTFEETRKRVIEVYEELRRLQRLRK